MGRPTFAFLFILVACTIVKAAFEIGQIASINDQNWFQYVNQIQKFGIIIFYSKFGPKLSLSCPTVSISNIPTVKAELSENSFFRTRFDVKRAPILGLVRKSASSDLQYHLWKEILTCKALRQLMFKLGSTITEVHPFFYANEQIILHYQDLYFSEPFINVLIGRSNECLSICDSQLQPVRYNFEEILTLTNRRSINELSEKGYSECVEKGLTVFLGVLDSVNEREKAEREKMVMEDALLNESRLCVFWIEGAINPHKKVLLGFSKDSLPPLFGLMNPERKYFMDNRINFNAKSLKVFIENYFFEEEKQRWGEIFSTQIHQFRAHKYLTLETPTLPYLEIKTPNSGEIFNALEYTILRINRFLLEPLQFKAKFQYSREKQALLRLSTNKIIELQSRWDSELELCQEVKNYLMGSLRLPREVCIEEERLLEYYQSNDIMSEL